MIILIWVFISDVQKSLLLIQFFAWFEGSPTHFRAFWTSMAPPRPLPGLSWDSPWAFPGPFHINRLPINRKTAVFHMILYDFHEILYSFHMILYDFQMCNRYRWISTCHDDITTPQQQALEYGCVCADWWNDQVDTALASGQGAWATLCGHQQMKRYV